MASLSGAASSPMNLKQLPTFFLTLLIVTPFQLCSAVNSIEIMQQSLAFSCVDWKITGVCFWLKCGGFPPGCSIKTSVKVRHFNPDAIVQVYQTPGEVPWTEMSFISSLSSFGQRSLVATGSNPGMDQRSR